MADVVQQRIRPPDVLGAGRSLLDSVGEATLFAFAIIKELRRPRTWAHSALSHAYAMGVRSLPLVLFMAFLGGSVAALQTAAQFSYAVPTWVAGSVVTSGVLTELGPVLTAMVLVGRLGASIAAELGTMRVTEQIDALYAMGRDPVNFLVVPRVLGGLMVVPPLVILADGMGLFSGLTVGVFSMDGLTASAFIMGMRFYFRPFVLVYSVLKAALFGLAITFLACFIGLRGRGGAEGVGRTTTAAVVAITVTIMVLDVLMVPLLKAY